MQAFSRLAEAALRLAEYMGYLRVDQVNQYIWDDYTAHRFNKKNTKNGDLIRVSNGTLRREYNVLMAALRRAWKDKHLHHPPEIEAPRDSAPRDRYLTKDEARRLIDACETPHVKLFVALAIYTGAQGIYSGPDMGAC